MMYNIDMPLITLTCIICSKKYKMSSWYKARLFCSNKCRGEWLKNNGTKPPSRKGSIPWNKGLTLNEDKRLKKISETRKGKLNWQYKHGASKSIKSAWGTAIYKAWRKAVFERDDYTCQVCGVRGGVLNADHIKCFAHYPSLRWEVSNGRTLCLDCHKKTANYGFHKEEKCK